MYILTPAEEVRLKAAVERLDAGLGIPDDEVQNELEKWLMELEASLKSTGTPLC
ncbi:MAG: hypothetical protein ACRC2T_05650 [Thermoguttaceae bacterium]